MGVGGQDDQVIMEVFQLNDDQKDKLKSWSAELQVRNDILKDRAKHLLKRHENSPPEVLAIFSKQYKDILDSMKQNALMMDKRLLSILNAKQYNLYLELCSQLTLRPMYVDRSVDEK